VFVPIAVAGRIGGPRYSSGSAGGAAGSRRALDQMIPRWKRLGDPPKDEAEHFMRCPACGGGMDCRDLGQVLFEHEGPLPHPPQDQPQ